MLFSTNTHVSHSLVTASEWNMSPLQPHNKAESAMNTRMSNSKYLLSSNIMPVGTIYCMADVNTLLHILNCSQAQLDGTNLVPSAQINLTKAQILHAERTDRLQFLNILYKRDLEKA